MVFLKLFDDSEVPLEIVLIQNVKLEDIFYNLSIKVYKLKKIK